MIGDGILYAAHDIGYLFWLQDFYKELCEGICGIHAGWLMAISCTAAQDLSFTLHLSFTLVL